MDSVGNELLQLCLSVISVSYVLQWTLTVVYERIWQKKSVVNLKRASCLDLGGNGLFQLCLSVISVSFVCQLCLSVMSVSYVCQLCMSVTFMSYNGLLQLFMD